MGQVARASGVELPQVATRLQASTSRNNRASIEVDEEDEANFEEVEEGSDESNEEYNDEWTDDEVGND